MKVLHCPVEIAGNMNRTVKALRRAGVQAVSASYYDTWANYECDINLRINKIEDVEERKQKILDFANWALEEENFDIYHFHFGTSLLFEDQYTDLPILKERDKKIIFQFWGSDHHDMTWLYYDFAKFMGLKPPKPFYFNQRIYSCMKKMNQYADVMIAGDGIPRGLYIYGMIEPTEWTLEEKEKTRQEEIDDGNFVYNPSKTYFVHAPSSTLTKGTPIIYELFREAMKEGLPIEMIDPTLRGGPIPLDQAKRRYACADFCVDQAGGGTVGLFGLECMLWEIPALAQQTNFYNRIRGPMPVLNITRDNFKGMLKSCVEMKNNKTEYRKLQKESRDWVLGNATIDNSVPKYIEIYEALMAGKRIKQFINTNWFRQEVIFIETLKGEREKNPFFTFIRENNLWESLGYLEPKYDKDLYE